MNREELHEALKSRRPVKAKNRFNETLSFACVSAVIYRADESNNEKIEVELTDVVNNNCRVICSPENVSYQ